MNKGDFINAASSVPLFQGRGGCCIISSNNLRLFPLAVNNSVKTLDPLCLHCLQNYTYSEMPVGLISEEGPEPCTCVALSKCNHGTRQELVVRLINGVGCNIQIHTLARQLPHQLSSGADAAPRGGSSLLGVPKGIRSVIQGASGGQLFHNLRNVHRGGGWVPLQGSQVHLEELG